VIVAAALCASPPLLHPALTGRAVVLPELRSACAEAVARLLGEGPEVVVVVGPAAVTGEWDAAGRLDAAAFAPGAVVSGPAVVSGSAGVSSPAVLASAGVSGPAVLGSAVSGSVAVGGAGALPLSLGLGAMLLDLGGYRGLRRLFAVGPDAPTRACAALGAELAAGAGRTGLLVMGDGSARRSLKAPGHLDPRAEPFDADVERVVRAGRLGALLELDEALARDLMATGRPAWQVLAGAMPHGPEPDRAGPDGFGSDEAGVDGAGPDGAGVDGAGVDGAGVDGALMTEVLYCDDPFGVAYLVACLCPRPRL
jgi:hypothetical protein